MKKILLSVLMLSMLTACSSGVDDTTPETTPTDTTAAAEVTATPNATSASTIASEPTLRLPGQQETAEGTMHLTGDSGDTKDGEPIVIFGVDDMMFMGVRVDYEGFDGSMYTYIFIDGEEVDRDQWGEEGTSSISLEEDMLKVGLHTVEVIQWSGEDMTGDVTMYKKAQYEVKP